MKKEWSETDLAAIAGQLANPTGEGGIKTGEMMNLSNNGMIATTIALLSIQEGNRVLEIGPGNGNHVSELMKLYEITYTGVDISLTMIEEASRRYSEDVLKGNVNFILSDGNQLPFQSDFFDKIFTVNTIYFWKDPVKYASEIYRILKTDGTFNLALATKSFMKKLPFTKYGFQLYDKETAVSLMSEAGFQVQEIIEQIDITIGNMGQPVERDIMVLICTKYAD
ncbi:class I SAM-dependent methyltransferase [Dyadobacter psychrotolerans]|uniref:Class I SAM-dependent methyltransferase n=1 Tax=Dyadobacter psychrotolerans TaxID=2541721 RepID=A0A4R5DSX4_9BACT|nr:class I SAM-dependent methyltransferase [Dyadobacter psychrotolerans]TDE15464.1 class I SAM-dependent methyltransferase [Dyadobacter psychrotolerans]